MEAGCAGGAGVYSVEAEEIKVNDLGAHVASQSPALASPLPKHTVGLA